MIDPYLIDFVRARPITALVSANFITLSMVNDLIDELPRLISESDTHVSQLALMIVSRLSETMPQSMEKVRLVV